MNIFTLSDIFIYPVKSLAGIRISEWDVVETGLKYDRQWMLVDENGQFLSQRRLPKMVLIQTRLTDSELILSAPNFSDFSLSLELKVPFGKIVAMHNTFQMMPMRGLVRFWKCLVGLFIYPPKRNVVLIYDTQITLTVWHFQTVFRF